MSNRPLIILTGPTAAGKTDISIRLAEKLGGEIISADSMQVYRRMDIGTAKIRKEEMNGIPHHLIDVLEPTEPFNVSVFKELALRAADDIYSRGKIPIMVGGTGFYIQALLYDIDFCEEHSDGYREFMEQIAATSEGPDKLFEELRSVDPASCEIIHKNNVKKVIRALEFYHLYKKPISEHNKEQRVKESAYNSAYFVLNMDRQKLYDRINRRVDIMKDSGLVAEVKALYNKGYDLNYTSMQAIGYKELIEAFDNHGISETADSTNVLETYLEAAFEKIKLNTRHFAKRQMTWFRRERDVIYLDKDEMTEDEILEKIVGYVR